MAKENFERIGMPGSFLTHKVVDKKHKVERVVKNHDEAISEVLTQLTNDTYGVISSLDEINAVGHRIAWWRKVYFICNSNGNGGLFKAICVFFWCR